MITKLQQLYSNMQYEEFIGAIRQHLQENPSAYGQRLTKKWIKERYYDLFLQELEEDPQIIHELQQNLISKIKRVVTGEDRSSLRQKMAKKFIVDHDAAPMEDRGPRIVPPDLSHLTLVFAPGLLTTMVPVMAFRETFEVLESKFKIRVVQADSHPLRSCEANTQNFLDIIERGIGRDASGKIIPESNQRPVDTDFIFFGYSKGGPDIFTFLRMYPDFAKRTRAVVTFAGANQGSPLADGVYELLQKLSLVPTEEVEELFIKLLAPVIPVSVLRKVKDRDIPGAVQSLTIRRNNDFWKENGDVLEEMKIPIFAVSAAATILEVPYFQAQGKWALDNFDDRNDMQVLYEHSLAPIPMNTPTALLHTHHWDIAYEEFPAYTKLFSRNLRHRFPKVQMAIAIMKLLHELGILEE